MRCESCHGLGRIKTSELPCEECGGTGISHCCDGICVQPGAVETDAGQSKQAVRLTTDTDDLNKSGRDKAN